jgi:hypothetical protein
VIYTSQHCVTPPQLAYNSSLIRWAEHVSNICTVIVRIGLRFGNFEHDKVTIKMQRHDS